MAGTGPTVRRRQLGAELRRLREAAGMKIEDAAGRLECSMSKVSRVETGQGPIKARDVRDLLSWYGVTDAEQVEAVLNIHRDAQRLGWWAQYEEVLPSGMGTYAGLESDARALRVYEPMLVHGLLQTEAYAAAVMNAWHPGRPHEAERLVRFRMERQELLTRAEDPIALWAVFEESVLRRPVGGPGVMRAQLRHLVEAVARPNVTVQIMPLSKGVHSALAGAFTLMEFDQNSPNVVYVDSAAGNIYVEKDREVRDYVQRFDLLRAAAPDPAETMAVLERIAEEMRDT